LSGTAAMKALKIAFLWSLIAVLGCAVFQKPAEQARVADRAESAERIEPDRAPPGAGDEAGETAAQPDVPRNDGTPETRETPTIGEIDETSGPEAPPDESADFIDPMRDTDEAKALFFEQLRRLFERRAHAFEQTFPAASLGVCVKDMSDNSAVFEFDSDACFIPASLTKIVLCSAIVDCLRGPSGDLDPERSFLELSSWLSDRIPGTPNLRGLFEGINRYTVESAPRANRLSDDAGRFLAEVCPDAVFGDSVEEPLLRHLEKVSWTFPCNRVPSASGLSLENRLAPSQIADCLYHLDGVSGFAESLTPPGEGILARRMAGLEKRHRFKTGSMRNSGVVCIAGFVDHPVQRFSLVAMVNGLRGNQVPGAVRWLDDLVLESAM
jgi:hypothetical protein